MKSWSSTYSNDAILRLGTINSYRYGFQGQEKDDEVKGEGNSVNYQFRMHDPRVGRFFAVDPLTRRFPYWSPYVFSGNQVIHTIELEGLETEENLNQNEVEVNGNNSEGTFIQVSVVVGKEGDKIAWSGNTQLEQLSPVYVVKEGPGAQAKNFADAIDGDVIVNKDQNSLPAVRVCKNSVLGVEIQTQLSETLGLDFDKLSKKEQKLLMTVEWYKEDMSELFVYSPNDIVYSGIAIRMPVSVTIPTAVPVVMPRGGGIGNGEIAVDSKALAGRIVDNFAKTAKGKQAARAAKKTSSADSEYNQEAEHKSNTSPSKRQKHERGQERKGRDKGGEKGDKNRVRYK